MSVIFSNNTSTLVISGGTTAPLSGSNETWVVVSSSSFPPASSGSGTYFHVSDPALPNEIIKVVNVSGTTWSVVRGDESTLPVIHTSGFTVNQVVSAGDFSFLIPPSFPITITEGGTGQSTQQGALNSISGATTSGQYLRGNGSNVLMSPIQVSDVPVLNQNTTGTAANITGTLDTIPVPAANVSLNSHKIINLSNGSASSDAAAFGQIPVSLPPNGTAGGVLSGTYPNPGYANTPLPESGGTMTGWLAPAVISLTFGTTIAVNAALANSFNLTLTASTGTLSNPVNPVDSQIIRFRITQGTGGNFTLAYGSAYDFGSGSSPTLSVTAGKVDIIAFEYVSSISKWCYLGAAIPQGF